MHLSKVVQRDPAFDHLIAAYRATGFKHSTSSPVAREPDGGKTYDVVVIGSPNVNPGFRLVGNADYPEIADDYVKTFRILKALPCDVFLGAHGGYYGMVAKHERSERDTGTNPFVDPKGYRDYVAQKEKAFQDTLAAQRGAKPAESRR